MFDSRADRAEPDWRSLQAWLVVRHSIEFVLDVAKISRGEGDVIDPLLLTAILEANQAAVRHDPQLMQIYADAQSALPDDLRRPISVSALAESLRLPLESVRRRVHAWIETGVCVRRAAGVYIPQAVVTAPTYVAVQAARIERLSRLRDDFERAGLVAPMEPGARPFSELVRAADRLLAEYMLRTYDPVIELADGPVSGFVLLGLCAQNAQDSAASAPAVAARQAADIVAACPPCSVTTLCSRLGMPAETVRRRLLALEKRGLAVRGARGWSVAAPAALHAQIARIAAENEKNLRRLFTRLRELSRPSGAGS